MKGPILLKISLDKRNPMIFCFLLLFICLCQSQDLKGIKFEDNLLEARFGPENGYAVYNTGLLFEKFHFQKYLNTVGFSFSIHNKKK